MEIWAVGVTRKAATRRRDNKNMDHALTAQRDDEIFDVVDACDNVIGQATRREVHAGRLWHRAVHALAFDEAGRVFLQKRSMAKDTSPGCWDSSSSGHLDSGESYDAAVVREVGEEIGLVVTAVHGLTPVCKVDARAETGWEFVRVYRLRSGGPFTLHPAEIETGAWFTREEVARGISERPREFTRAFKFIWPLVVGSDVT
jgi:isopentenyl-diphosphate Delta-isomerase